MNNNSAQKLDFRLSTWISLFFGFLSLATLFSVKGTNPAIWENYLLFAISSLSGFVGRKVGAMATDGTNIDNFNYNRLSKLAISLNNSIMRVSFLLLVFNLIVSIVGYFRLRF